MATSESQDPEKDFLDIDLDAPLGSFEDEAADAGPAALPRETVVTAGDGVLLFDNKKYAVGLNWLIANDEGDTELALKRAKDSKADFYTMRQNVMPQHGFGYLKKGHRINMPALAALAADMLVGEWHGIFVADNGWWYVAVHADNIAPDGDLFFASEEAAYNHFIVQSETYRWPRTYAPESWNIPESTGEISLAKMLGDMAAPTLKPVTLDAIFSGKRNKNLAFGAGLITVGLIVVSLLGSQILPSLVPEQAQIPAPNLELGDDLQAPPQQVQQVEADKSLTNFDLVLPSAQVDSCLSGFANIAMALPGWTMGSLRCRESFVEASWDRQLGNFDTIEPYLSRFPEGVTKAFPSSNNLIVTRRLPTNKPVPPSGKLYERNYAIITMTRRFGNLGTLDIREVTPPASQQLVQGIDMMQQQSTFSEVIGQEVPEGIRPLTREDLPYLSLSLISRTPPNLVRDYFNMPGMILMTVQEDVPNGTWTYEAKLILQPEQRLLEAHAKAKALQVTQSQ